MADFSLGAAGGRNRLRQGTDQVVDEGIPSESLFLYSGGAARGFEIWQQNQQQIHQRHSQQQMYSASTGTLLAFGDPDEPIGSEPTGSGPSGGGVGRSCQDCGNQAKKDCVHMRCRTCCKSRGFHCNTHVKSTWVPAVKRRERQQQVIAAFQHSPARPRAAPGEVPKRPRDLPTRPTTVVAATGSGGTDGVLSFPTELNTPAVFRCVRVSPMELAGDQFAYQTEVSIGGHVFKGILYDQGPEPSSATGILGAGTSGNSTMVTTAALLPDPSSFYPAPVSAFMAGAQFFPHAPP